MQSFATKLCLSFGCFASVLLQILLSLLISCILGPILLLAGLINEFFRIIVSILLYIHYGRKIQLVPAGADNIWNYQREGNSRICFIMAICDQPINLEAHRVNFQTRVLNHVMEDGSKPYEKLTKIFTKRWGYFCFLQDSNFDIRNHVIEYPTHLNNSGIVTEHQLLRIILPELSLDMDGNKPQWEEVIIPQCKFRNEKEIKTVRIFRYHHGFMDGASALLMWANCMTEGGQREFPYPVDPLKPLKISKFLIILGNIYCVLMAAWTIVKSFHIGRAAKNRFATDKYTGLRHYSWSDKIDVSLIKKIGTSNKVSVPTVLSSATASALRQLEKKYPAGGSSKEYSALPDQLLIGLVTARLPYPDINPRNRFTVTHFNLPTGDMSWYQRVKKTNNEIQKLFWEPALHLNYFLFKFFGRFPIPVLQNIMENAGNPISFSNVPMTKEKISLWGNPTSDCAGWAPLLTNTGIHAF
jgi:hypothetical protein